MQIQRGVCDYPIIRDQYEKVLDYVAGKKEIKQQIWISSFNAYMDNKLTISMLVSRNLIEKMVSFFNYLHGRESLGAVGTDPYYRATAIVL